MLLAGAAGVFGSRRNLIDEVGKIGNTGAGHDDRIPTSVGLFGDSQELSAIVFAVFNEEVLPFHLQFPGFNNFVHD